jgi:hypothetical protein
MPKKSARVPAKVRGSATRKASVAKVTKVTAPHLGTPRLAKPELPLAVLRDVLESVPPSTRDGFVRAVTDNAPDALDAALWGSAPNERQLQAAALQTLRQQYQARHAVLSNSITRRETARLLGTSEQAVTDRLEAHDLVGLKQGREWRLPVWQFDPDAERGYLPGLAQLRAVFPGGPVSLTEWVTTPAADLDGVSPAEALAAGKVDDVVRAAGVGVAAAW